MIELLRNLSGADILILMLIVVCIFFSVRYCRRHKNVCGICSGDCDSCVKMMEKEDHSAPLGK